MYGGGYYKLENLPDPENNQILDIYILVEDISRFEDMNYLKDLITKDQRCSTDCSPSNTPHNLKDKKRFRSDDTGRGSIVNT